ncbi:MAG TPA: hypothetical protein PKX91_05160 [Clostridia bacterium]|jgi:hypothetical protein|nr:hypothetical protein [Clostridia bacterium]
MKKVLPVISLVLVVVLVAMFLVACGPSTVAKAKENLSEAGYLVAGGQREAEGVVGVIIATKLTSSMTGVLYSSTSAANADYKKIKEEHPNTTVEKIGKWVVWGDEAAIKAFKG